MKYRVTAKAIQVGLLLYEDQNRFIEKYGQERRLSKSAVVRKAIEELRKRSKA